MKVIPYGRLLFLVTSESRDMEHLVDLEPDTKSDGSFDIEEGEMQRCSCEAYLFHGHRPCKHILAAAKYIHRRKKDLRIIKPIKENHETSSAKQTSRPGGLHPRVYRLNSRTSYRGSN